MLGEMDLMEQGASYVLLEDHEMQRLKDQPPQASSERAHLWPLKGRRSQGMLPPFLEQGTVLPRAPRLACPAWISHILWVSKQSVETAAGSGKPPAGWFCNPPSSWERKE